MLPFVSRAFLDLKMLFVLDSKAALLACFMVLFAAKTYAAPSPCSGGLDNFNNNTSTLNCPHHHGHHHIHHYHHQICGTCPEGMQREVFQGPYCGRCLVIPTNCDDGYFKNEIGHCETCPCLKPHEERRFGTQCRVDIYEQVICDSSNEYTRHSSCPVGCTCLENCPPQRSFPSMELGGSQSKQNMSIVAIFTIVVLFYYAIM